MFGTVTVVLFRVFPTSTSDRIVFDPEHEFTGYVGGARREGHLMPFPYTTPLGEMFRAMYNAYPPHRRNGPGARSVARCKDVLPDAR